MTSPTTQLSLVAFYGEKGKNELWDKIDKIQSMIHQEIHDVFEPYEKTRLHGTIIGLEGLRIRGELISKNFIEIQKKEVKLDVEAVINFMLETNLLPLEIKFSGFNHANVNFTSRGDTPANRSISIQGNMIVLIGWPHINSSYSPQLDTIRRRLSSFGALHKYYVASNSYDNDFFLVLGNLNSSLDDVKRRNLLSRIREEIDGWDNITIELKTENLCIVQYEDVKLRKATSIRLKDALTMIKTLEHSYPEVKNR